MIGFKPQSDSVPQGCNGTARKVSFDHGFTIELNNIRNIFATVEFHTHTDPVSPSGRVDSYPLSNDWLIKIIPNDVVAIFVTKKQLWGSINFFII